MLDSEINVAEEKLNPEVKLEVKPQEITNFEKMSLAEKESFIEVLIAIDALIWLKKFNKDDKETENNVEEYFKKLSGLHAKLFENYGKQLTDLKKEIEFEEKNELTNQVTLDFLSNNFQTLIETKRIEKCLEDYFQSFEKYFEEKRSILSNTQDQGLAIIQASLAYVKVIYRTAERLKIIKKEKISSEMIDFLDNIPDKTEKILENASVEKKFEELKRLVEETKERFKNLLEDRGLEIITAQPASVSIKNNEVTNSEPSFLEIGPGKFEYDSSIVINPTISENEKKSFLGKAIVFIKNLLFSLAARAEGFLKGIFGKSPSETIITQSKDSQENFVKNEEKTKKIINSKQLDPRIGSTFEKAKNQKQVEKS